MVEPGVEAGQHQQRHPHIQLQGQGEGAAGWATSLIRIFLVIGHVSNILTCWCMKMRVQTRCGSQEASSTTGTTSRYEVRRGLLTWIQEDIRLGDFVSFCLIFLCSETDVGE